jgi:hypothetical protein
MQSQANNLINAIKSYIEGKLNYNVGLSLFMRICCDKSILIELFGAETKAKKQLLTDKLLEYYEEQEQLDQRKCASIRNSKNNNSSSRNNAEGNEDSILRPDNYRFIAVSNIPSDDSIIESLESEWRNLYRQRGIIHVDLYNAISDEKRHEIALNLMRIQKQIDGINEEKRKVKAGSIPERFIKQSRTAEEFIEIQNLKSYIAKFERLLKKEITAEEREKYQRLLNKHQSKLEKIING